MMRAFLAALAALCLSALSAAAQQTNIPCNQLPALTGGVTTAAGSCATTTAAWTTFTPTPTCGSATFTVTYAKSITIGKITFAAVDFTFTGLGTCGNTLTFTLPNTSNGSGALAGGETVTANQAWKCTVASGSNTATCLKNAGTAYAGTDRLIASGVYENQ